MTEYTFLSGEINRVEQGSSRLITYTIKVLCLAGDEFVAVSHGVAEDLKKFMWNHSQLIHVIYNSVVTANFYKLAEMECA